MKAATFQYPERIPISVSLLPATALAADEYDLWVGGTRVTSANANDVFEDGKVKYDNGSKTLTLNNYSYSTTDNSVTEAIRSYTDITIEL